MLRLGGVQKPQLEIGDIVVYKVKGRDIPIVHRVLELHERSVPRIYSSSEKIERERVVPYLTGYCAVVCYVCRATDGNQVYLTKGDNNNVDDRCDTAVVSIELHRVQD